MSDDNPYHRPVWPDEKEELDSLEEDTCWHYLDTGTIARLAVTAESGPDIFPINYLTRNRILFFRSAPGTKIVDLTNHPQVAVEIDGNHDKEWWSVVVHGTARRLNDDAEIQASGITNLHTTTPTTKWNYFQITPHTVTGIHFHTTTPNHLDER